MNSDDGILLQVLLIQEHHRQNKERVDVRKRPIRIKGCTCVGVSCDCRFINGFYPTWNDPAWNEA